MLPERVMAPVPFTVRVPVPEIALATAYAFERLMTSAALLMTDVVPSVPVVEPVPTWTVPAEMVKLPEKELMPSRISVLLAETTPADFVKPRPPLISPTLRSVPERRLKVLIGRAAAPMTKPLRFSEALSRVSVEVTEPEPAPVPLTMLPRTSSVPPLSARDVVTTPFALLEAPRVTGPRMVRVGVPVTFTAATTVPPPAVVTVLLPMVMPATPTLKAREPPMFRVPVVVATSLLAREAMRMLLASNVPVSMDKVAVVLPPVVAVFAERVSAPTSMSVG